MRPKYKLSITTFDTVGGVHFYGSIYRDGVKVHEVTHPRSYVYTTGKVEMIDSVKFDTADELVDAARAWFLSAPDIPAGSRLVTWRGYNDDYGKTDWSMNPVALQAKHRLTVAMIRKAEALMIANAKPLRPFFVQDTVARDLGLSPRAASRPDA